MSIQIKVKESINNFSSKLATQLIASFLAIFLAILSISSIFLYTEIVNILRSNSEKNTIQKFGTAQYNINTFCSQIDLISRQMIIDANLQGLTGYSSMEKSRGIIFLSDVFREFSNILGNYKFIDSIYYYGSNGLILYASSKENQIVNNEPGKGDWFYSSEIYSEAKAGSLSLKWFGGYTDFDFNLKKSDHGSNSVQPEYYVSAARNIYTGNQNSILVLNISEKIFTSIYNSSVGQKQDSMYIINNKGKIISSADQTKVGKQNQVGFDIHFVKQVETVITESNRQKNQTVLYRLANSGWILVDEVPMRIITADIFKLRNIILIIFIISLVIAGALSRYWIYRITRPLADLTSTFKKMELGELGLTVRFSVKNELGVLVSRFNKMSIAIRELFLQKELIQEEKRKIEMQALRSQINPHFIYNTLNTIKWMAVINRADNIVECVGVLSDILQPIFKKNDTTCTLEDEILYIKNYIKIMNFRFADKIKTKYNIPPEFLNYNVLRFILQPVVENSLVHGLGGKNEGEVGIAVSEQNRDLLITVTDNGAGIEESKLNEINKFLLDNVDTDINSEAKIGLININRRIKLHYGSGYGIVINSRPGEGTEVILKMPAVQKS